MSGERGRPARRQRRRGGRGDARGGDGLDRMAQRLQRRQGPRRSGPGGAPVSTHIGQSRWPAPISCTPSSVCTMALTRPAPEQISSIACGLTIGEAMATSSDSRNSASTTAHQAQARSPACQQGHAEDQVVQRLHGGRLCRMPPLVPQCTCGRRARVCSSQVSTGAWRSMTAPGRSDAPKPARAASGYASSARTSDPAPPAVPHVRAAPCPR